MSRLRFAVRSRVWAVLRGVRLSVALVWGVVSVALVAAVGTPFFWGLGVLWCAVLLVAVACSVRPPNVVAKAMGRRGVRR